MKSESWETSFQMLHSHYSWHKRITLYFPLVLAVFLEASLSRHLIGSVPNLHAVERDHPTGSTSSSLASDFTFKLTHSTEIYGISVTSRQTLSLTDSQRERAKKAVGIFYFPLRVQWKEKNKLNNQTKHPLSQSFPIMPRMLIKISLSGTSLLQNYPILLLRRARTNLERKAIFVYCFTVKHIHT